MIKLLNQILARPKIFLKYSVLATTTGCTGMAQKKDIHTKSLLMLHIPVPTDIAQSADLILNKLFSSNQSHSIKKKSLVTYLILLS